MIRKDMVRFTILSCALTIPMATARGAVDVRTGLWETRVESSVEGMPMAPPPVTHRTCVTGDDLVPDMDAAGQECEVLEHDINGNRVSWRVSCSHEGMTTTGNGLITYSGDRYEGKIEMNMQGGPMGAMKMTQTITGKRVGECD